MKPAPFAYHRPGTVAEAVRLLAADPDAKVLAGGQSLVPLLSMRLATPSALVDLGGIPGLDAVRVDADGVRVGALARHARVLADDDAAACQPLLRLALGHVAHPTIRNRGTTVGSVVHADPAAEMPVVLRLLGGSVDVEGPAGRRTIGAADLFVGPLETSLHHDEVATSAFFPALPSGGGVAFEEIARRHGDYAMAGVAVVVRREGEQVVDVRAGFVSISDTPVVVDLTDAVARGADPGDAALASLEPTADVHATADYRAHLVRVLTRRVVGAALDDAASRSLTR
ncbi:FAD binding domain-containing protein [Nocardioides sp. Soil805]|uniref:FAD binding domain-containing protein n=1 Tax=Nocardioides sp. Soil805 TaxID=1736416 RepID=UPI000703752E|nr:xanthine dehydrogenase family protein subunit M [Nocardioides sp. Soil805]KRF36328.1 molybdopterin dehydrogenase [Nocardioides sp. Soil805]